MTFTKLDLKNERGEDLKIFVFTISPTQVVSVMSYDIDGAIRRLKQFPLKAHFTFAGADPVSNIINAVNIKKESGMKLLIEKPNEKKKTKAEKLNEFYFNTLLLADESDISKRDKSDLKRIINKLKKKI